jgi:hypothetical protein
MADSANEDSGLLGNLPNRRPGVESRRRAEARRTTARRRRAEGAAPPGEPAEATARPGSGFEQLALAGFGLATGMAGAGLRLAGRAAGEIGKVVGRR